MPFQWSDERFSVGNDEMDDTHKEFVELVNKLEQADDKTFASLFDELIRHTEEHFENESRLMAECNFPARGEHEGEHQKLLGECAQMRKRVAAGRFTMPRAFVRERLTDWFTWHASSMDAPLAVHLKKSLD